MSNAIVMGNANGNPLIGETRVDTLGRVYDQMEFLCLAVDSDSEMAHPGLAQSLRMVREALDELRREA